MKHASHGMDRNLIPPGWTHNPSAWPKRTALAFFALAGFGCALYLALYQMHVIFHAWDPLFGDGTPRVLTPWVSRLFPIPDALLGAMAYLVEIILDLLGGHDRWRTAPWAAIGFGLVAALMALASLGLIIAQPTLLHAWCTLCLVSAVISFLIVGPALTELRAAWQHVRGERRRGRRAWKALLGQG